MGNFGAGACGCKTGGADAGGGLGTKGAVGVTGGGGGIVVAIVFTFNMI